MINARSTPRTMLRPFHPFLDDTPLVDLWTAYNFGSNGEWDNMADA
jgi:hypothetical protein